MKTLLRKINDWRPYFLLAIAQILYHYFTTMDMQNNPSQKIGGVIEQTNNIAPNWNHPTTSPETKISYKEISFKWVT